MPYKICPECRSSNGTRTYKCKSCGFVFAIKEESVQEIAKRLAKEEKRRKRLEKLQKKRAASRVARTPWYELRENDIFECKGGPYFLTAENEKIRMGYKGRFKVKRVDETGILAYSEQFGYCFILMVDQGYSTETFLYRMAHKIRVVSHKKPEAEVAVA